VGNGKSPDEAEHPGQGFALRPVIPDLGLEVGEADLGVVLIRGLVDGEQGVAQQRGVEPRGAPLPALESEAVLRRVWLALPLSSRKR
jgi:hypothetical protein